MLEALIAVAVLGVGWRLYLVYADAQHERGLRPLRRAMKRGTPIALDEVPEREDVIVEGEVVAGEELLAAPLTGRACVYYRAWVWKKGSEGREVWQEDRRAFVLRDGHERVTVLVDKAQFEAREDWLGIDDEHARQRVDAFALAQRHQFEALRSQLDAREAVIEVGQRLRIFGRAIAEPTDDANEARIDLRSVRGATVINARYVMVPDTEPRFISLTEDAGEA